MSSRSFRTPAAVALIAAVLGLAFAWQSTRDYARHLDRQMHDLHCSYVPGVAAEAGADLGCRTALFSPFSAVARTEISGGIPISLFAVGAFAFFGGFSLYLLLAGRAAPRRAHRFLGFAGLTPLLVSIVMATISAVVLGEFCKTCVGIYSASTLLAAAGIAALIVDRRDIKLPPPELAPTAGASALPKTVVDDVPAFRPRLLGSGWVALGWLGALGLFTVAPATLYASAVPDYEDDIAGCGELAKDPHKLKELLQISDGSVAATALVDPLCPTCKALHQRLEAEDFLKKLDLRMALFPLDKECNWMLERSVHPGACVVSKAILCSEERAPAVLDWAYEKQDAILSAAKKDDGAGAREFVLRKYPRLEECIDSEETEQRLSSMMRFAVENQLIVSTPQFFLGKQRICPEDTDLGLSYTLRTLAPELR